MHMHIKAYVLNAAWVALTKHCIYEFPDPYNRLKRGDNTRMIGSWVEISWSLKDKDISV